MRVGAERADDVHEVAIGPVVKLEQGPKANDANVHFVVGPEALLLRGHGFADGEPFRGYGGLPFGTKPRIFSVVSATELLKQVKALPDRERQKLFLAILSLEEAAAPRMPAKTKRVKWPDVEARAKRIFGNRVLPNLVLLERSGRAVDGALSAR